MPSIIILLVGVAGGFFLSRHSREVTRALIRTGIMAGQGIQSIKEGVTEDIEDYMAELKAESKPKTKTKS